jgi:hypothetical protein
VEEIAAVKQLEVRRQAAATARSNINTSKDEANINKNAADKALPSLRVTSSPQQAQEQHTGTRNSAAITSATTAKSVRDRLMFGDADPEPTATVDDDDAILLHRLKHIAVAQPIATIFSTYHGRHVGGEYDKHTAENRVMKAYRPYVPGPGHLGDRSDRYGLVSHAYPAFSQRGRVIPVAVSHFPGQRQELDVQAVTDRALHNGHIALQLGNSPSAQPASSSSSSPSSISVMVPGQMAPIVARGGLQRPRASNVQADMALRQHVNDMVYQPGSIGLGGQQYHQQQISMTDHFVEQHRRRRNDLMATGDAEFGDTISHMLGAHI